MSESDRLALKMDFQYRGMDTTIALETGTEFIPDDKSDRQIFEDVVNAVQQTFEPRGSPLTDYELVERVDGGGGDGR